MKHIVLDPDLVYSDKFNNFFFRYANGGRSDYFRVDPSIKVTDGIMEENTFRVIRSKKTGYPRLVPAREMSQRCLCMLTVNTDNEYERLRLNEDLTECELIDAYTARDINGNDCLKIIAILSPKKPLFVEVYNIYAEDKPRYECYVYDAITEMVLHNTLNSDEMATSKKESVLEEYDKRFDSARMRINYESIKNLTPEDVAAAEEYFKKYHSYLKDL